jgi:hypothetical protein
MGSAEIIDSTPQYGFKDRRRRRPQRKRSRKVAAHAGRGEVTDDLVIWGQADRANGRFLAR